MAVTISRRCWISFLVLLAVFGGVRLRAQMSTPSEYQVKAAFLYNFGKFVEWPADAFSDAEAPLVIGIYGNNPFGHDLEVMVAGKKIGSHPVDVRRVSALTDLRRCHIVFISMSEQKNTASVVEALRGRGVLTVTENMKHFAGSELIINFVMENDQVHFEINGAAADRTGLAISSKLLSLARKPEK